MLSDDELNKITERCHNISPAPWHWAPCEENDDGLDPTAPWALYCNDISEIFVIDDSTIQIATNDSNYLQEIRNDFDFIVACRTDVPALLHTIAVYRRALEKVKELEAKINDVK
jgi:hypothetical protein